jgi:two-component system response regulator ChvI
MAGNPKRSPKGLSAKLSNTDIIRVLFVEDDPDYREALGAELAEHGFIVHSYADGASLLDSLGAAADADVIVLDWSLPKISGIDLLPQLRQVGVNLPVVFLTGRALTVAQESLAFDRGAIDFIDKARGGEVLVWRLRRVVETGRAAQVGKPAADPQTDKLMVYGRLELRPNVSRAYWDEMDVGLTVSEYNVVHLLASNIGGYVTYRAIYDRVNYTGFIAGSGSHGYRVNVRAIIKRIRIKFREYDPTFNEIQNYAGFGYCWGKPEGTD